MEQRFKMVAKTFQGLEHVLATELAALGADDVQEGRRVVSFTGDKALLYKANFALRTALRVLKPIKEFKATTADDVYNEVKAIEWDTLLDLDQTFAVDSVVYSEQFRHSMFVSYRVKDAIADYFREQTGKRPSVSVKNPDVLLNIHVNDDDCILSLDSTGESLHKRGYRVGSVEAPLNEVLAAGLIMMTGWHGECDLIDPMCGSGTIPIEAALIAKNVAPGVFRSNYAFEKWPDYDRELFESIYNDDSQEREFEHHIYAYDNDPKAVNVARANMKSSGTAKDIDLEFRAMEEFQQPAEKSVMITNPPYGERISTDNLLGLYKTIGERLKHAFIGNQAWILSYREECFDEIGLKPTTKIPVLNGDLECQFREYEIFDGKYKAFREDGEQLDKKRDEEPGRRFPKGDRPERRGDRSYPRFRDRDGGQEGKEDRPWRRAGEGRGPWHKDRDGKDGESRGFRRRDDNREWSKDGRKQWRKDGGEGQRGERRQWHRDDDRRGGYGDRKRDGGERRQFESYPERKKRERRERSENQNTENEQ